MLPTRTAGLFDRTGPNEVYADFVAQKKGTIFGVEPIS